MPESSRAPRRAASRPALVLLLAASLAAGCSPGGEESSATPSTASATRSGPVPLEESAAYSAYQSGMKYVEAGDWDLAAQEFQRALKLDRFQVEVYYQFARALNELQADQMLGDVLDQALSLTSDHPGLLALMGDYQARRKQPQKAVKRFRQSLALDEAQPDVHFKLGRALVYLSDAQAGARVIDHEKLGEGISHLERAVALSPDTADYHLWLGMAYDRENEQAKGLAEYQRVVELDPENGRGQLQLAVGLVAQGRIEEAKAAFASALEIIPDDPELNYQDGLLLEQENDLEGAVAAYEKAIAGDPANHEPYFRMCNVLIRLGQEERANQYCESAEYWSKLKDQLQYWHLEVKTHPDDPQALAKLAEVYYLRREPGEALSWAGRAIDVDRKHPLANTYAGVIFFEQGEPEKARGFLETALAGAPEDSLALEYAARLYLQLGELDHAKDAVERLAAVSPDDPATSLLQGSYLVDAGELEAARKAFQACIDGAPDSPEAIDALCRIGEISFREEAYQEAATTLRKVLELAPEHEAARELLSAVEARLAEKDQG